MSIIPFPGKADGRPRSYAYPSARNTIGPAELEAASDVLASGRFTMGPKVRAFEEAFAEWIGSPHAVMVNSGSSANLLMVESMMRGTDRPMPWRPGDEVLVPALSWPTTVWPIVQLGLTPVFTDIDPDTLAIDPASARTVVSDRTRGMVLIHVLGQAPNMQPILEFNAAHGIELLEDSCETLGAHAGGRHTGTIGTMGSFSFYFSHHLTAIEGGMVATADEGLRDDLRSMRSHGWARDRGDRDRWISANRDIDPRFLFVGTGYNLRPIELNAAIAMVQLDRLEEMLKQREEIAELVAGWISTNGWLRLYGAERLGAPRVAGRPWLEHSWMMLPFELADDAPVSKDDVTEYLEKAGIETRPIVAGNLVRHPAVRQIEYRAAESLANADRVLERGFMIGCHPMSEPHELRRLETALTNLASL
jgi:CDP-4-dehydro-6-deoxyglucose reductase, E1